MKDIMSLIKEAQSTLETNWVMEGGRACPKSFPVDCSQPVFIKPLTGEYDYGQPGGPGHQFCTDYCKHKYSFVGEHFDCN